MNHNIVQRQQAYETSRILAASSPARSDGKVGKPGNTNFYCKDAGCDVKQPVMNLFVSGGYGE